ncbi:MAG: hypothetical protein CL476_05835 [Acidobacteria bacterium]|nr:hypothetical protein [Acidobacteriota bacterium]
MNERRISLFGSRIRIALRSPLMWTHNSRSPTVTLSAPRSLRLGVSTVELTCSPLTAIVVPGRARTVVSPSRYSNTPTSAGAEASGSTKSFSVLAPNR